MGRWNSNEFKVLGKCFFELGILFICLLACLFMILYGQKLVLSNWECPSSPLPPHYTKPQMAGMCAICFFLVDLCLHKARLRIVLSSTQYAYVLCIKPTVFHCQWVLTGHFRAGSMVSCKVAWGLRNDFCEQ